MRYQLIGRKIPHVGKTLWEIVGNLKNFGVGRLVKKNNGDLYSEPSFFRIVKVLPIPPPKKQFYERGVIVWVDEVFRGMKMPVRRTERNNEIPKFQLIPKSEEEEYLKKAEECAQTFSKKTVPKYSPWPPLYKLLWERQRIFKNNKRIQTPLPKLNLEIAENSKLRVTIDENDTTAPPLSTSLHKKDVSVEDMIKEIVKLKKIIKSHSMMSEK